MGFWPIVRNAGYTGITNKNLSKCELSNVVTKWGIPTVRSKMGHLPEFLILRDFDLKPGLASINALLIVTSEWGER